MTKQILTISKRDDYNDGISRAETVVRCLVALSLAALLVSAYYICLSKPIETTKRRRLSVAIEEDVELQELDGTGVDPLLGARN